MRAAARVSAGARRPASRLAPMLCGLMLAGLAATFAGAASAADDASAPAAAKPGDVGSAISPAEQLLFLDDHLAGVKSGAKLGYRIEHHGVTPAVPDESFTLGVAGKPDKRKLTLTEQRGDFPLPDGEGATPNPMILYFLDREVAGMERGTGGQRRHFQRLIRTALAQGPEIRPGATEVGGKRVATREVVIQPYLTDPERTRYPEQAGKRFRFVLANDVPGRVAEVHAEVPAPDGSFGAEGVEDVLRFTGAR